ncbi:MAG: AraC family transcriptional regulator [Lachnospiraceae bacterium]|nr:AraC family transcriptional regulator [Lachnospiraceae bacterium]
MLQYYDARRLDKCIKRLSKVRFPNITEPVSVNITWVRIRYNLEGAKYHGVKWHSHNCYEVHIVYQGEMRYQMETGDEFVLQGNDYLLIYPGMIHRLSWVSECAISYSVFFEVSSASDTEKFSFPAGSVKGTAEIFTPLFDLLIMALERNEPDFQWIVRNVISSVILSVSEKGTSKDKDDQENTAVDIRYQSAVQFIGDNAQTNIQSSDVAEFVGLSVRQLNRLFRMYDGISLYRYISQVRCNAAKELLKNRELSISYIAGRLAFSSEYNFIRFFNRMEGMPPGRYREMTGV